MTSRWGAHKVFWWPRGSQDSFTHILVRSQTNARLRSEQTWPNLPERQVQLSNALALWWSALLLAPIVAAKETLRSDEATSLPNRGHNRSVETNEKNSCVERPALTSKKYARCPGQQFAELLVVTEQRRTPKFRLPPFPPPKKVLHNLFSVQFP